MDEVIKSQFHFQEHTGELTHVRTQPTENLILTQNAEMRKDNILGDLSFGRQVASIPFVLWEAGIRAGYAMNSPDPEISQREIFRFLKSDMGKPCMVRDKL